uniref:hypothetical protein n=1 Tax=Ningiella ruwaisensis TaxID=2364274 RepID=UPI0010A01554|nr:hypothetical protein [Ningiella ruwaisensis]
MEATKNHHNFIDYVINLIIGILFVFAVITAFGYGAAVAIPKNFLEPLSLFSPTLAFSVVDLITQGIPAALIFVFLSLALKLSKIRAVYTLLAMPFVLFMLSAIPELLMIEGSSGFYLASLFAKVLPVVFCALFLAKWNRVNYSA